ncbi:MAG: hypothetical protein ABIN67_14395 [Ferruginibacter sp.]
MHSTKKTQQKSCVHFFAVTSLNEHLSIAENVAYYEGTFRYKKETSFCLSARPLKEALQGRK